MIQSNSSTFIGNTLSLATPTLSASSQLTHDLLDPTSSRISFNGTATNAYGVALLGTGNTSISPTIIKDAATRPRKARLSRIILERLELRVPPTFGNADSQLAALAQPRSPVLAVSSGVESQITFSPVAPEVQRWAEGQLKKRSHPDTAAAAITATALSLPLAIVEDSVNIRPRFTSAVGVGSNARSAMSSPTVPALPAGVGPSLDPLTVQGCVEVTSGAASQYLQGLAFQGIKLEIGHHPLWQQGFLEVQWDLESSHLQGLGLASSWRSADQQTPLVAAPFVKIELPVIQPQSQAQAQILAKGHMQQCQAPQLHQMQSQSSPLWLWDVPRSPPSNHSPPVAPSMAGQPALADPWGCGSAAVPPTTCHSAAAATAAAAIVAAIPTDTSRLLDMYAATAWTGVVATTLL